MTTLQEDAEQLGLAFRNFGRAIEEAIRTDLKRLKEKIMTIIDAQDKSKIYREVFVDYDHDHYDTASCTWCEQGLDHTRLVWEASTGNVYNFCPHCGYELNLVEETDLPKLSEIEVQEIVDAKKPR